MSLHVVIYPVILCDKCPIALEYVKQPDGSMLLWHCKSNCSRCFQFFEVPTVELKLAGSYFPTEDFRNGLVDFRAQAELAPGNPRAQGGFAHRKRK